MQTYRFWVCIKIAEREETSFPDCRLSRLLVLVQSVYSEDGDA